MVRSGVTGSVLIGSVLLGSVHIGSGLMMVNIVSYKANVNSFRLASASRHRSGSSGARRRNVLRYLSFDDLEVHPPDAFDSHRDGVAGLQCGVVVEPVATPHLGEASAAAGSASEHIARMDLGAARRVGDHVGERERHTVESVAAEKLPVYLGADFDRKGRSVSVRLQFVSADECGSERCRCPCPWQVRARPASR